MQAERKFYFPAFDSLRFLLALVVVFCHVEFLKHYYGYSTFFSMETTYEIGKAGLSCFLAQSGFLITLLMLDERQRNGHVAVGRFYMRRILRIWPMYYVLVGVAFFVLPRFGAFYIPGQSEELAAHFNIKLLFLLLLSPQLMLIFFRHAVPAAEQLWSVGMEEIFYFTWPWFFRFSRNVFRTALILTAGVVLMRNFLYYFSSVSSDPAVNDRVYKAYLFFYYNRLECLFAGSAFACLFFERHSLMKRLSDAPWAEGVVLLLIVGSVVFHHQLSFVDYGSHALLFSVFISIYAMRHSSILPLHWHISPFIGKITYSIYILHYIVLLACFHFSGFGVQPQAGVHSVPWWMHPMVMALTTAGAVVTYYTIEKPVLKLKSRFR